ncbi:hypothetical protein SAMN05518684_10867 [Salipaludibacillus aurantiacus]|uniref:Repeat domain-containing protein n=2 Tax=Salipaludibacillus aurantiacus TaxID=1601833 RepID=A0A1H9UPG4_9BACI|nr:hypothetical protein SAMN05518684_10867 [Salipaludibacillus aurantiacus]
MTYHSAYPRQTQAYVIDYKQSDVTGDGVPDHLYLVGERPYGMESAYTVNISLYIQDGRTGRWHQIIPKENAGYQPTIFLGDFTGNGVNEIMLSIFSGGSGGYTFYYIYSYLNNTSTVVFDHEVFNQEVTYTVTYKDNYQVEVAGSNTNTYTIDLKYKGEEYLSEIYNPDGTLKEPIQGWVNPLGGLYPVDFQRNGVYGLYATQRIAGRYNADAIGEVQTALDWNGERFAPLFQTVGIFG